MKAKNTEKMFQRILKILDKLSVGERPKLKELAAEFEVDVRTIRRDITERLSFFPLGIENGVVIMADGFVFPRSGLKDEELLTTELAFSAICGMSDAIDKQLQTIRAKISYPLYATPYYVKAEQFEKINIEKSLLNKIEDAITKQNISKVTSNDITSVVEPYKIVAFDGLWYLFAKDLSDGKIKTYLLAQVTEFRASLKVYSSDQKAILKMLNNVHSAWFEDGNSFEVIIKVMPEIAHVFKLKKFLSSQEIIKEQKDSTLVVKFTISTDEDIDNLIKAWLPHIEVIKPDRLRKQIQKELEIYMILLRNNNLVIVN